MSIDNETTVDGQEPAGTISGILVTLGLVVGIVTVGLFVCVVAITARAYVQALTGTVRPAFDGASIDPGQGARVSGEGEGSGREDVRSRPGSLESRYSSLITRRKLQKTSTMFGHWADTYGARASLVVLRAVRGLLAKSAAAFTKSASVGAPSSSAPSSPH
jgi:hypothetical protein